MKVLVTGGAGFIGRYVVDALLTENYDVAVIDYDRTSALSRMENVEYYPVDITRGLDQVFEIEQPECVIHLAAQVDVTKSAADPGLDAETNIYGTINILKSCQKHRVGKIIFASSAAVYGEPQFLGISEDHPQVPISFYGISKHAAENYVKLYASLHGINYTILRYANVYGPVFDQKGEGNVIFNFLEKMTNGRRPIIYGNGNQTRDFIFVKDVAAAILAAIRRGDQQTLNIGTNLPTNLNQLAAQLNSLLGTELMPEYLTDRSGDIKESYLENKKALRELDWKVRYPLTKGLKETIENWNHDPLNDMDKNYQ
ncbi:NAD-dependent epimerase/dehydratase family protein [Sediminibacillus albus]|uniref:UDP-glucose 4-epimerase n=1 Tax=Sediminibacillus albus TaxID=407036 RepID=A0A1G8WG89_9BACI|nr:NAD-dependent epimerase/dehydratase family protein [Sediminibacillus albus]SDJ77328.1 UDP-glucose 4-epimerase [Sediminibacillus albus]